MTKLQVYSSWFDKYFRSLPDKTLLYWNATITTLRKEGRKKEAQAINDDINQYILQRLNQIAEYKGVKPYERVGKATD